MTTALSSEHVLPSLSAALAALAERVAPAIVQVHGRPRRPASGIVVAHERVLTTAHSVEGDAVRVRAGDGKVLPAEVAGEDPGSDLVLLRVGGLSTAALAFSGEAPRLGHLGLLTGRSWRGNQQARLTVISGVGGPVQTMSGARLEQVLQLPTSVYAGYSGSAVIAPDGTLAAVATAGLVRGAALALPASFVRDIVQALDERGTIHRGYLGVATQAVRLTARQERLGGRAEGLLVMNVAGGSPAENGGLLVGDVLVGVDGRTLESPEDLLAWLGPERVGHSATFEVVRGETTVSVELVVGPRPSRRA